MNSSSDIIHSIIASINSDVTKSESQKKEMIKFLTNQEKFNNTTNHLEEKFEALMSFIKFIETNVPQSSCKIYGSFVRQMFEKMFLSTYDDSGYGDSENHDVDLHIFESKEKYFEAKTEFNNIIDTFEVMEKLDFDANIKFGDFHLVKITDMTLDLDEPTKESLQRMKKTLSEYILRYNTHSDNPINIEDAELPSHTMMRYRARINRIEHSIKEKFNGVPHFNIILKNPLNNKYIIIDMLSFPIDSNNYDIRSDINVNTLCITHNGIESKSDFIDTLRCIYKRKGIMKIDMNKMINDLKNNSLEFSEKAKLYNNFVNFVGFRTKILSVGYTNIFSDIDKQICDIYIERNESCPITFAKPPYLVMNLECTHNISIMALAGLANIRQSEYTEAINCPICRAKLIPKMVDKQTDIIVIPDPSIISDIFTTGQSRRNSISIKIPNYMQNEIMSKDNLNIVFEHLGLKDKKEE